MALVELVKVDPNGTLIVKEVGVSKYGAMTVIDRACVAAENEQQVNHWIVEMMPKDLKWEDGQPAGKQPA